LVKIDWSRAQASDIARTQLRPAKSNKNRQEFSQESRDAVDIGWFCDFLIFVWFRSALLT
jgi:hypothetical protein